MQKLLQFISCMQKIAHPVLHDMQKITIIWWLGTELQEYIIFSIRFAYR